MLIIPEHAFCLVCVPKTGSQAMARHLETELRDNTSRTFDVESLHDWHANIEEVEATGALPFSLYDVWSFTVVRNPFDRFVSYCAFDDPEFQRNPQQSMDTHLQLIEAGEVSRWLLPQSYFTAGVKQVYRYEDLPTATREINERFGIDPAKPLELVNESVRTRYQAYYDSQLKARVEAAYREDIQAFGYRF